MGRDGVGGGDRWGAVSKLKQKFKQKQCCAINR